MGRPNAYGHVELEAGGQQQDRGNGAQASTNERMKTMNLAIGSQWEWILSSDQSKIICKLLI